MKFINKGTRGFGHTAPIASNYYWTKDFIFKVFMTIEIKNGDSVDIMWNNYIFQDNETMLSTFRFNGHDDYRIDRTDGDTLTDEELRSVITDSYRHFQKSYNERIKELEGLRELDNLTDSMINGLIQPLRDSVLASLT